MNKKILISIFILVALAQLYVPFNMILSREETISVGQMFKFPVEPVDPHDPFLGKYVRLNFRNDRIAHEEEDTNWTMGQKLYITLENDENGFAAISSVSDVEPDGDNWMPVTFDWYHNTKKEVIITYPFTRYYMEESKAKPAEDLYRQSVRSDSSIAYATVFVHQGEAVLTGLFIDDVPIEILAAEKRDEE